MSSPRHQGRSEGRKCVKERLALKRRKCGKLLAMRTDSMCALLRSHTKSVVIGSGDSSLHSSARGCENERRRGEIALKIIQSCDSKCFCEY
eukprot:225959-Amphidinium_carterae.1